MLETAEERPRERPKKRKTEICEEDLTMEDQEPRDADDGDELEAAIMQTDHAFGAESVGTTAEEGREGETLDQRLAEERPERPSNDEALSVFDEGLSDDESELVGDAVTQRDEFASPEEAAMSVREDAPGATDHEDPHPEETSS